MRSLLRRMVGQTGDLEHDEGDETCIYAVGDIHGHADLLHELCARIDADIRKFRPARPIQVFLGDYIDRGPDSRDVIAMLDQRRRTHSLVCLLGNHEACLLEFLVNPDMLAQWRQFGGLQTLMSYGLTPSLNPDAAERRALAQTLVRQMPPAHLAFLRSLPITYSCGRYFFVHAGVRPGVALKQQRKEDLLWIRDDFLVSEDDFGKVVVHGHTPVHEAELLRNRINVDTGAYATGRLTCVKLEGARRTLLMTGNRAARHG
jgi:serine/threonine protein phosphatase 1